MKSAPFLELLLANPALICTADRSLRIASLISSRDGQCPNASMIGMHLTVLWDEAGLDPAVMDAHQRAVKGHSTRFEFAAGDRCWIGRVEPLRGTARQVEGISAVFFDHTDRSFAEKSLRLSEQSYRSLIEEAPFAIARATPSGQLLQVNRAMAEMLRYESEQDLLIRSLHSDIFVKAKAYDQFVSELSLKGALQGIESMWRRSDGKPIPVSLAGRATRDDLGRISYLEILAENITERQQLEHQLRQSQKLQAVGQLAGGIAHDFNNLLTIINGQIQMALAELVPGSPLRDRLQDVESAADRASKLTRQLLSFGRANTAEAKILNINAVISGLTPMLSVMIGKTVDWEFTPDPQLGHVNADPVQIEQVLINLVLNARDATPERGRLTISTENVRIDASSPHARLAPAGDYVAVTVQDSGHGMSPETQARIFEPFFTTKKPGQGTGLGLATVYSIVKESKGFIFTESEPGAGSRFIIYFPRVAAPAKADSPAVLPVSGGGSETILFADDEEIIRKFTSSFLSRLGYRVICAADGLEAIDLAKTHASEIDLLITDIVMPRMGGRELAESLRSTLPDLKILFISGYSGDESVRDAIKALNAQLLQKPFASMPAFARNVREVLDQQ